MAVQMTLIMSAATRQILLEAPGGPSVAVDAAVTHWVSCQCKANIRARKLEVCDYCKEQDRLSDLHPDLFPRPHKV